LAGLATSSSTRARQSWCVAITSLSPSPSLALALTLDLVTKDFRLSLLTNAPSQLDAGQHPAYDGLAALPFFDDFDLSTVDVLLISQ
jgi:hypothetical protein